MESDKLTELTDTQKERDHRELRIDKVGVRNLRFPIRIRDKANAHQDTIATIGMFVDLPHHFKGTHMSRFIEVLNTHGNVVHVENIPEIDPSPPPSYSLEDDMQREITELKT